ncbi:hypothetical protein FRC09_009522 [Ceratobasidium sp. 395]|nr:hypothetical protein FRC09_009522 [Ceratobasidium sp. 395]
MAPPISQELRERIVYWRTTLGWSIDQCVIASGRSRSRVFEVLRLHRTYGVVHNPLAHRTGRPRKLSTGDKGYTVSVLRARPTLFLDELAALLEQQRAVTVSTSTLSRTLNNCDITHKHVAHEALQRNEPTRATWIARWGRFAAACFAWLDESGVNDMTGIRDAGWAVTGHACVVRSSFDRGIKYSVLPILTTEGIVAAEVFIGAVNKELFIQFLRQQVAPLLNPFTEHNTLPRSILVCDNCAIHYDEEIRQIVEVECGAKLCYLPPYSPDMNPIEQAFSSMKAWLKRNTPPLFVDPDSRPWLIHQALMAITPDDACGWIENSGYAL